MFNAYWIKWIPCTLVEAIDMMDRNEVLCYSDNKGGIFAVGQCDIDRMCTVERFTPVIFAEAENDKRIIWVNVPFGFGITTRESIASENARRQKRAQTVA